MNYVSGKTVEEMESFSCWLNFNQVKSLSFR